MGSRWRQLLQLRRGFRALFPPAAAWGPARSPASAVSCRLLGSGNGPTGGGRPEKGGGGWGAGGGEESDGEGGEEEEDGELEAEELVESALPSLPLGAQRVFVVHPAVKWGPGKARLTTGVKHAAGPGLGQPRSQKWS